MGELHRDHELGGWPSAERLQRIEILQGHGLLVDALGCLEDGLEGVAEALRAQDGSLPIALCTKDR